jgi:hypothetical protein
MAGFDVEFSRQSGKQNIHPAKDADHVVQEARGSLFR